MAYRGIGFFMFLGLSLMAQYTKKVSVGFMPSGPQLAATNGNGTFAALRPVHPGGS